MDDRKVNEDINWDAKREKEKMAKDFNKTNMTLDNAEC